MSGIYWTSTASCLSRIRWATLNSSVWAALLRKLVSSSYIACASQAPETSFSRDGMKGDSHEV